MVILHMKIRSKINNKTSRIYRESNNDETDFVVKVYNETMLISTYFTSNEIDAIQEAQLSLI